MPTYEYQCQKCAYKFERFQRITEEPLKTCPKCQGPAQRLISAGAGFIFKGAGFYATDYRSKEYQEKKKQENKTCDSKVCKECPMSKDKTTK